MSALAVVLAAAVITIGSRIAALAVLPPPPEALAGVVGRLPAPLFAALAAHSLVGSGGGAPEPAVLVAAGCALVAAMRWPSLLITLVAGLAGFGVASLVL